nr:MAG: hypothetical protein [Lokiarchaeota virus Skoll Meg22_1214]
MLMKELRKTILFLKCFLENEWKINLNKILLDEPGDGNIRLNFQFYLHKGDEDLYYEIELEGENLGNVRFYDIKDVLKNYENEKI